jgi:hypothetical protein
LAIRTRSSTAHLNGVNNLGLHSFLQHPFDHTENVVLFLSPKMAASAGMYITSVSPFVTATWDTLSCTYKGIKGAQDGLLTGRDPTIRAAQTVVYFFSTFLELRPVSATNDLQTSINGRLAIWISEFTMGCLSMCMRHVWPKLALNPETSKKNKRLSERPYCHGRTLLFTDISGHRMRSHRQSCSTQYTVRSGTLTADRRRARVSIPKGAGWPSHPRQGVWTECCDNRTVSAGHIEEKRASAKRVRRGVWDEWGSRDGLNSANGNTVLSR